MARAVLTVVCALMIGLGAGVVWAAPIEPGVDLLKTPPGGAFWPDPFAGPVPLKGVPVDPSESLGNADTIVSRTGSLPAAGTGTIPAEIVALSLMSIDPIMRPDPAGDPGTWDVRVSLNPDRKSTGGVEVTTHDDAAGGGTFDSFFDVFTEATYDEVGGDRMFTETREDMIGSIGTPWSHTPPPNYPGAPSGGFFITSAGIFHQGPHPRNVPAERIPEPATLLILGAGLAGLGAAAWRERRSG